MFECDGEDTGAIAFLYFSLRRWSVLSGSFGPVATPYREA
jgi:hypothetical protein